MLQRTRWENKVFVDTSFNTAGGRCCCNFIPRIVTYLGLKPSFNTAGGRCCCNFVSRRAEYDNMTARFNTAGGRCCCNWIKSEKILKKFKKSFNTAGGRCCCNGRTALQKDCVLCGVSIPQAVGVVATYNSSLLTCAIPVSIPQAVGVVATSELMEGVFNANIRFQYRRR